MTKLFYDMYPQVTEVLMYSDGQVDKREQCCITNRPYCSLALVIASKPISKSEDLQTPQFYFCIISLMTELDAYRHDAIGEASLSPPQCDQPYISARNIVVENGGEVGSAQTTLRTSNNVSFQSP